MVLQSDMMHPVVGYKHQHDYSHEEEDSYSQNNYNYSSMQMARPNPYHSPNKQHNYMISAPQPSQTHVAMQPGGGYPTPQHGHNDHYNKDKYYGNKDKYYESTDKYYDNKDKYYGNKDKYYDGFINNVKEKFEDGYGGQKHSSDNYYGGKQHSFDDHYNGGKKHSYDGDYWHGQNGNKHQEKLSIDKLMSGGGGSGYGSTETHYVTPHHMFMEPNKIRRPTGGGYYDQKKMDTWEFKSLDD